MAVQHAGLHFVPQMLLQVASSINKDTMLPLHVPVATIYFLRRLGSRCDHSTKPLGRFLLLVPSSGLVDEIIRILLPEEFHELRAELKHLQLTKEQAIANQQRQRARILRDQTNELKDRLQRMGQGDTIDVQPGHVLQAIANLGFNDAIDLTE